MPFYTRIKEGEPPDAFSRPSRHLTFVARHDAIDYAHFDSVNACDIGGRPAMLIGRIDERYFMRRKLNSEGLRRQ